MMEHIEKSIENRQMNEKKEITCWIPPMKKQITYIPPPKSRSKYTRKEIQKRNGKYICSNRINLLAVPNKRRAILTLEQFKATLPLGKLDAFRNNLINKPNFSVKCAVKNFDAKKRKKKRSGGKKQIIYDKNFLCKLEEYSRMLAEYVMKPQPKLLSCKIEKVVYDTVVASLPENCQCHIKNRMERQVLFNIARIVANLLHKIEEVIQFSDCIENSADSSSSTSLKADQSLAEFLYDMLNKLCKLKSKNLL